VANAGSTPGYRSSSAAPSERQGRCAPAWQISFESTPESGEIQSIRTKQACNELDETACDEDRSRYIL
jgi:hypothetical protein